MKNSKSDSQRFTFIDLFCGAGGLSLGFQKTGFICKRAVDNDPAAVSTYDQNFKDHISCEEITENTVIDDPDVIIGGPPCQGFSSAGLRNPNDKRSTLVRVFSTLVASHKPKAFVFENVEGFLTASGGGKVLDLLEPLVEAGYRIHLRKVNAANYGVPQHRKRVIAIGALGWNPSFPEPTHMAFGAPGSARIKINNRKRLTPCPTLCDILESLPTPVSAPPGFPDGHYIRPISESYLQKIRLLQPGQTMKDLPQELWHQSFQRRAYRRVMDGTPTERRGGAPAGLKRLRGDQPSKAITSGAVSEFIHPAENRFLTLRECAKIQTFPDDFAFSGTFSKIILQIGNAVPPLLAEKIAESLYHDLCAKKPQKDGGAILSFLPTISYGMSPALEKACSMLTDKFGIIPYNRGAQYHLWH